MKTLKYKDSSGEYQSLYEIHKPLKVIDFNGYEYVDMGEAGYWATCNVGATKPEEYGLYFGYREITGYTEALVKNKDHIFDGSLYEWDIPFDDLTDSLPLEEDAAHVNMGGSWRMPTKDEFQKLYLFCDVTRIPIDTSVNGSAYKFSLKNDPSKTILLPLAGYTVKTLGNNQDVYRQIGGTCLYYLSSLDNGYPYGYFLLLTSDDDDVDIGVVIRKNPYIGGTIRGFIPKPE